MTDNDKIAITIRQMQIVIDGLKSINERLSKQLELEHGCSCQRLGKD